MTFKSNPASPTGGVKAFPIEGPMGNERYRLQGMTPEERAWRIQWLKDQTLSPNEPKPIPGYYKERLNPIRRFYRWPLEMVFRPMIPSLGYELAGNLRWWTGKIGLTFLTMVSTYYYFKYNTADWTRLKGFRVRSSRAAVFPGEPGYPYTSNKEPSEYATDGFDKSPI